VTEYLLEGQLITDDDLLEEDECDDDDGVILLQKYLDSQTLNDIDQDQEILN